MNDTSAGTGRPSSTRKKQSVSRVAPSGRAAGRASSFTHGPAVTTTASASSSSGVDPGAVAHVEPAAERLERPVGEDDPRLGLEHARSAGGGRTGKRRSASSRLEPLPGHSGLVEPARRALLDRVDDLEQPVEAEQRLAGLGLELAPAARAPPAPAAPSAGRRTRAGRCASGRGSTRACARARTARGRRRRPARAQPPGRREPHHARADDGDASQRGSGARRSPRPRARRRRPAGASARRRARGCSPSDRARAEDVAGQQPRVPRRVLDELAPTRGAVAELAARALLAVHARDHLADEPSNSSGVTTTGPMRRREVLALRRPEPDAHLAPLQVARRPVVQTVKPPIAPSAPITAATSSS